MSSNILEGELQKQGEKGLVKSYKKRNFRLRDDGFLRYFDGAKETGSIDMTLVSEVKTDNAEGVDFQIVTERRIYNLRAATNDEMKYWLKGLDDYLHPKSATSKLKDKAKKAGSKAKKAAAGAAVAAGDAATKTARTIQYGEALSDQEVEELKKQKAKDKAKRDKEKLKEKERRDRERDKLSEMERLEQERHERAKDKIKAQKSKVK